MHQRLEEVQSSVGLYMCFYRAAGEYLLGLAELQGFEHVYAFS